MSEEKTATATATAEVVAFPERRVYSSLDDFVKAGGQDIEYAEVRGFREGEVFRIGSVTAGDVMEWQDAKDDKEKKTAGLRLICKSLVGPPPSNSRYADSTNQETMDKNINTLRKVRHKEVDRVVGEILTLNGMNIKGKTPTDEAKKD
jgi:hypothetical protein